jgi:hypothetical protein
MKRSKRMTCCICHRFCRIQTMTKYFTDPEGKEYYICWNCKHYNPKVRKNTKIFIV